MQSCDFKNKEDSEKSNESIKHLKVVKHSIPKGVVVPLAVSVAVYILLHTVFLFGYVPTESMEPTLKTGSFFIANRLAKDYEVGEVAVFRMNGVFLVKRIAGVGGDMIESNGNIYEVPKDHFFMLGDNSDNSYDSRYWENPYVPKDDMEAVVLFPFVNKVSEGK